MIELPETFRILHGIPYEPIDAVRSDACKAYGDQRAAEAREQMREECIAAAMAEHENPNNLELIQIGALQAGRAIRKLP